MSVDPSLHNTRTGAQEAPAGPHDTQRRVGADRGSQDENRDSLSAGLIQSHPEQTSSIQHWIGNIQLYRFPLALAVVAVHSGEFVSTLSRTTSSGGGSTYGLWAVDFLTLISRLATPSFLLISGLIFFKDGKVSSDQYSRKVKSRCRTLLVPYLVWNFLAVLLLCAPSVQYFFLPYGDYKDTPLTLNWLAKCMIGWPMYPADGPLWFVRDVLLLIAFVPLLNLIPRRVQMFGLGALFVYWLQSPIDLIPGGVPRAFSVLFFLIGAAMGMNQTWLRASAKASWLIYTAAAALLVSAAGGATCTTLGEGYSGLGSFLEKVVRISGALLVVCAAVKGKVPDWLAVRLNRLSPVAFFLFASHYLAFVFFTPLIAKIAQARLGQGHEVVLFGLVFSTVIAISLAFYFLLARYAPSFLGILDGNRSARASLREQLEVRSLRKANGLVGVLQRR